MIDHREPFLHEVVMLLALHGGKGNSIAGGTLVHALGGAILAELLMSGRIRLEETKKKLVIMSDGRKTGDALLDECLAMIAGAERPRSLQTWLTRFAGMRHIVSRVSTDLCRQGILRADEERVLLMFPHTIYREADSRPGHKLFERLRRAVLSENRDVEPRTAVILSLAKSAGLLKAVFDKHELKDRRTRIATIVRGDAVGKEARKAIEASQAALVVSAILPAVISSAD